MTNRPFPTPFETLTPDMFSKFFAMPGAMNSDSIGALARETMAASTQSTRASVKGLQDTGSALLRQINERTALSVKTGKKLADITSPEDAVAVHADYIRASIEANMKGLSELSTLYADTVREAFMPLAKSTKKPAKKG